MRYPVFQNSINYMKIFSATLLKYLAIIPVLFLVMVLTVPAVTLAGNVNPGAGTGSGGQDNGSGQGAGGRDNGQPAIDNVALENPLNNINSIDGLLVAILNIVMVLMIPVIVFFIIYAGFKYVMAQGNASQVEEATRALTYAVIGGVLILGAVAISQIIQNVVRAF